MQGPEVDAPCTALLCIPCSRRLFSRLPCRYVYDHIGGDHSAVIPELAASVATFVITTLWLGPCDIVYLWSVLNCFGLNFELWAQKLAEHGPLAQIEVGRRFQAVTGWDQTDNRRWWHSAFWSHPGTLNPWSRTFSLNLSCLPGQCFTQWESGWP